MGSWMLFFSFSSLVLFRVSGNSNSRLSKKKTLLGLNSFRSHISLLSSCFLLFFPLFAPSIHSWEWVPLQQRLLFLILLNPPHISQWCQWTRISNIASDNGTWLDYAGLFFRSTPCYNPRICWRVAPISRSFPLVCLEDCANASISAAWAVGKDNNNLFGHCNVHGWQMVMGKKLCHDECHQGYERGKREDWNHCV